MMNTISLGASELRVTPIGLGTMTFGEQVSEPDAHAILDRAVERGVNLIDTAEMYSVPPRAETYGRTEAIIGNWLKARPGMRQRIVLASKVAGPSRDAPWIRAGSGMTAADIEASCNASLRRLQTDVIDLYQIHWPERQVPAFGRLYYDPAQEHSQTPILEQLQALARLVQAGKVRHIGLSNETPYGVHEFVRLAEQLGLPRVVSVQNAYCLINRSVDNALDESCHRLNVGLLAFSPLGAGLLTGKYDAGMPADARLGLEGQGWLQRMVVGPQDADRPGRARRFVAIAQELGVAPAPLAIAWCLRNRHVSSVLLGASRLEQLRQNLDALDLLATVEDAAWRRIEAATA